MIKNTSRKTTKTKINLEFLNTTTKKPRIEKVTVIDRISTKKNNKKWTKQQQPSLN